MSLLDRRLLLFGGLTALLGGCGYKPLLGRNGPARDLKGEFAYSVAGGRDGFIIEEMLRHRLGETDSSPDYDLIVSLTTNLRDSGVSGSGGIDRKSIDGIATFEVRDSHDGTVLLNSSVHGSTSWTATSQEISSLTARRSAEDRLYEQVSQRIADQIFAAAEILRG